MIFYTVSTKKAMILCVFWLIVKDVVVVWETDQDGVLHSTKLDFYYFTPRIWHVFRSSSGTTINWTVLTTSDPGICIKFESFTVDTRTHLTRTRTLAGIISGLNTRLHTAGLINI